MNISVFDLRLSFIWATFDDRLFQDPAPAAPFAFLGRDSTYASRFAQVQAYRGDPDQLIPPWAQHRGKDFWSMYLNHDPHEIDPWRAWKQFVPLRRRLSTRVGAPWLPGHVKSEAYFYPHAHALVVDVALRGVPGSGGMPLDEAVDVAMAVRGEKQLAIDADAPEQRSMTLNAFAAETLSSMARLAIGTPTGAALNPPYSVTTFVRVEGVDPAAEFGSDEVRRALEAVTQWPTSWRFAPLPNVADAAVRDPDYPPSHTIYRRRRGRATWFPALAATSSARHRKLTCYHRNQTFAALQIESLGLLISRTAERARAGAPVPLAQERCARFAAGLLGRMYGDTRDTYRSGACREHLVEGGLVDDLEYIRGFYAMAPLH